MVVGVSEKRIFRGGRVGERTGRVHRRRRGSAQQSLHIFHVMAAADARARAHTHTHTHTHYEQLRR